MDGKDSKVTLNPRDPVLSHFIRAVKPKCEVMLVVHHRASKVVQLLTLLMQVSGGCA